MQFALKTLALTALGCLIVGLLLGFLPQHAANSRLKQENASLTQSGSSTQKQLALTQRKLQLSGFAVRSAEVSSQVESNNYSVASASASGLFTDLRKYVDEKPNDGAVPQIREVLSTRDQTIAALAKADPAVKLVLQQIFNKLQGGSPASH